MNSAKQFLWICLFIGINIISVNASVVYQACDDSDLILENQVIQRGQSISQCSKGNITFRNSYIVENGGHADIVAGGTITLLPGFEVKSGGKISLRTLGTDDKAPTIVSSFPENESVVPTQGKSISFLTTFNDDNPIASISLLDGEANDITDQATVTENTIELNIEAPESREYVYTLVVEDLQGNILTKEIRFIADTTVPETTVSIEGGEFSEPTTVDLICSEDATIHYSIDGYPPAFGAENTISQPSPVLGIKIYQSTNLQFFAIDTAGNIEPIKSEIYLFNNMPRPVTDLSASYNEQISQVEMSWSSTAEHPLNGYYIYRCINPVEKKILEESIKGGYPPPKKLRLASLIAKTSYNDPEIFSGITAWYGITAKSQTGTESRLTRIISVAIPESGLAETRKDAVQKALNWLEANQSLQGYWGEKENLRMLATSQILNALHLAGKNNAGIQKALFYLRGNFANNNDYLARKIIALSDYGQNTDVFVNRLIAQRNYSDFSYPGIYRMGWGTQKRYAIDAMDTSLGLMALKKNAKIFNENDNGFNSLRLDCPLEDMDTERYGWQYSQKESIYISSIVYHCLKSYWPWPDVSEYDLNIIWILSSQNTDGSFGNGQIDTAGALLWLSDYLPFVKKINALNYLIRQQASDGSWEKDPYLTGLCLTSILSVKPDIEITYPSDDLWVTENKISVSGSMVGDFECLTVNGQTATILGDTFSVDNIDLQEGQNTITLTGTDDNGSVYNKIIHVVYTSPSFLYVDPSGDDSGLCTSPGDGACASINAAISKAVETNKDKIYIASGGYQEPTVTISQNLSLIGAVSPSLPEIRPQNTTNVDWFNIDGTGKVAFKNLIFNASNRNIRSALNYQSVNSAGLVENCKFLGNSSLQPEQSFVRAEGPITAIHNFVEDCMGDSAFNLYKDNNTITHNKIVHSKYGIESNGSSNNVFQSNEFNDCKMGIRLGLESADNTISDNAYINCDHDVYQKSAIEIISPLYGTQQAVSPVSVSGSIVNGYNLLSLQVNDIPATITGNTFIADGIPLSEGVNQIQAVGTGSSGENYTDTIKLFYTPGMIIYVDPSGDDFGTCKTPGSGACASLNAAITKAEASNAHTIKIASGTYIEPTITISKKIEFIGADSPSKPVLVASASPANQRFAWFTVAGEPDMETQFVNLVFDGNQISNMNTFQFDFRDSHGKSIFSSCEFKNATVGIESFRTDLTTRDCDFENVLQAIQTYSTSEIVVTNCSYTGNPDTIGSHIFCGTYSGAKLTAEYNLIKNFSFQDFTQSAFVLQRANTGGHVVRFNTIENGKTGIEDLGKDGVFSHNVIKNCQFGIRYFTSDKNNTISNNTFINDEYAIYSKWEDHNTVNDNTFQNCQYNYFLEPNDLDAWPFF